MDLELNYFEQNSITELLYLKDGFEYDYLNWTTTIFFDLVFKDVLTIKEYNGILYIEKGEEFFKYSFNYIENQIVYILKKSDSIKFKVVDLISIIYDKTPDKYDLKQTLLDSKLNSLANKKFILKVLGYFDFRNNIEYNSKIYLRNKKKFEIFLKNSFLNSTHEIKTWFDKLNGKVFLMSNCFIDFFIYFDENEKKAYELFYSKQIEHYKKMKINLVSRNTSYNSNTCGSACSSGCSGCNSGCSGCGGD